MAVQSHTVLFGKGPQPSRSLFLVGPESSSASTTFLCSPNTVFKAQLKSTHFRETSGM